MQATVLVSREADACVRLQYPAQTLNVFFLGDKLWQLLHQLWRDDQGQDIAEYAVMLAVILVIVVGTVRLIGSNANNVSPTSPVPFSKLSLSKILPGAA